MALTPVKCSILLTNPGLTLLSAVDTSNMMVKMQVFDLLSAVTVYSEDGFFLALDALNNYKVSVSYEQYRLQVLTEKVCSLF